MAELNLKQIIDRLNAGFTGETRKLVFWYDDKAEFEEDMKTVELPSYTRLGMAALLPHKTLVMKDDYEVYADDVLCNDLAGRQTVLQNHCNGNRISGSISAATKDFVVNYQDLQGLGMTSTLALSTLIALCSISLGKPVQSSLAVLGEISIRGTMIKVENSQILCKYVLIVVQRRYCYLRHRQSILEQFLRI